MAQVQLTRPLTARGRGTLHEVTFTIAPLGGLAAAPQQLPGLFLSPIERLIVDAVRAAQTVNPENGVIGKKLATLIGFPHDSTLRVLLSNLVQRQVLNSGGGDGNGGYRLAVPSK